MSSRFEALLDLYRDAMDRCIQNEVHNADCRADERIEEETISEQHKQELQCRADILSAYLDLQTENEKLRIRLQG